MTNPNPGNPFAPAVPTQQPQQGGNPYGQPQQQPPVGNPYGQPQQPQQGNPYGGAPAPAPYGQPQQQPAPYGQPQQPPAYGQQAPNAYAPQQQPAAAPPALDPSMMNAAPPPPPTGDGKGAKWPDMYGRLVAVFPLSFEQRPKNPQFITQQDRASGNLMQDQVTATVVVLDDGQGGFSRPVTWGGNPMRNIAPTDSAPLPYVRKAMWISQSRMVGQLKPYLPQAPGGLGGLVYGRVLKAGNEHNSPWYIGQPTEADTAMVRQYLDAVAQGAVPHPLAA